MEESNNSRQNSHDNMISTILIVKDPLTNKASQYITSWYF